MMWSLALLLLCQLAGNVAHDLAGWPIPGPVTGMALLLLLLVARDTYSNAGSRRSSRETSLPAANALLPYLSLLFVPPGVAAVMHARALAHTWPAVFAALLGSAILTLAVTGLLIQALLRRSSAQGQAPQARVGGGEPATEAVR